MKGAPNETRTTIERNGDYDEKKGCDPQRISSMYDTYSCVSSYFRTKEKGITF